MRLFYRSKRSRKLIWSEHANAKWKKEMINERKIKLFCCEQQFSRSLCASSCFRWCIKRFHNWSLSIASFCSIKLKFTQKSIHRRRTKREIKKSLKSNRKLLHKIISGNSFNFYILSTSKFTYSDMLHDLKLIRIFANVFFRKIERR